MKSGVDGLPIETAFSDSMGQILYNGVLYNVLSAPVAAVASGDNAIVAAVAGKQTIVIGFFLSAAGAVNGKWRSGTTDITGAFIFAAAGGSLNVVPGRHPLFATAVNTALNLNNSAATAINGFVLYINA